MTLEDMNENERAGVEELRNRMKGLMTQEMFEDDYLFQRFLRARNHNLDAAETMLKNHINWRNKNKLDTFLADYKPPEVLSKYIPMNRLAYDKEGCPVFYSHVGQLDNKGIMKSCSKKDINDYITYFLESNLVEMKKMSEKIGKPVEKWSYILNYDGFSLSVGTHKPTIDVFINLIKLYDHNYPERLKTAYLINGSLGLTLCWPICKAFLSGPTLQKMKLFGRDGWQDEIYKHIDLDAIPGFLGGNLTDPDGDPMCRTIVKFAGVVPEHYHVYRKNAYMNRLQNAKKIVISRMSKAEVKLEVMYPGSKIEWEFDVKSRDIGFSLLYEQNGYTETEVKAAIPKQRIETDLMPESGTYLCNEAGVYILEFDNTYSWLHSKEIHYIVSVVNPQNQKSALIQ